MGGGLFYPVLLKTLTIGMSLQVGLLYGFLSRFHADSGSPSKTLPSCPNGTVHDETELVNIATGTSPHVPPVPMPPAKCPCVIIFVVSVFLGIKELLF